jgi:hypothetical protein
MKRMFTLSVIAVSFILFPVAVQAQTAPIYSFNSYTLDSGSNLTVGAVYRFEKVIPGIDAFVKITSISSGISLRDIDRTADGYGLAFQPEYRISGNTNGYIDFKITFVNEGTNTPATQALVTATGIDIDGSYIGSGSTTNVLKENNKLDMGGGVAEYNSISSELIISQTGTEFTGANYTGNLYGALVDTTAREVMYSVTNTNVTSFTYRVGSNNLTSSNSTRYASLYFKKFTYQHFPLAVSGLKYFQGSVKNNNAQLDWELETGKYKSVLLEKSFTSESFSSLTEYEIKGSASKFQYTDPLSSSVQFYRLKCITMSGKTEYSAILTMKPETDNQERFSVFPTLVRSSATVQINTTVRSSAKLLIVDYTGREVKQQNLSLNAGSNSFTIDGFDRLAKGNYFVVVKNAGFVQSKQVLVR